MKAGLSGVARACSVIVGIVFYPFYVTLRCTTIRRLHSPKKALLSEGSENDNRLP
jgi:hypothetical protein